MLYALVVALGVALLMAKHYRNKWEFAVEIGEYENIWNHTKMTAVYKNGSLFSVWVRDVAEGVDFLKSGDSDKFIRQIYLEHPHSSGDDDPFGGPKHILWYGGEVVYSAKEEGHA